MCVMTIRFSEFRHSVQTISQPQMCGSLVRGSPVLLLYWFGGGLVLVRAQLNQILIDEDLVASCSHSYIALIRHPTTWKECGETRSVSEIK